MMVIDLYKQLDGVADSTNIHVKEQLPEGALVAVYGPSGIGKTTFLRLLAGLTTADEGKIIINGECWWDKEKGVNWSPQRRRVGFVFQDYALFPNMTVLENLKFANNNSPLIQELLEITELESLQHRRPNTLSGGQQQRVALARALVMEPSILLLDEPLAALDQQLRKSMQDLIKNLHQRYNMTTFMVSHDASEICALASHLLFFQNTEVTLETNPIAFFKNQEGGNQLELEGIVLAIDGTNVRLRIGDIENCMQLSSQQLEGIKIGDKMKLSTTVLNAKLTKSKDL